MLAEQLKMHSSRNLNIEHRTFQDYMDEHILGDDGTVGITYQTHVKDNVLRGLYDAAQPLMKRMVNYNLESSKSSSYGADYGYDDENDESETIQDDVLEEKLIDKLQMAQETLKVQKIEKVKVVPLGKETLSTRLSKFNIRPRSASMTGKT